MAVNDIAAVVDALRRLGMDASDWRSPDGTHSGRVVCGGFQFYFDNNGDTWVWDYQDSEGNLIDSSSTDVPRDTAPATVADNIVGIVRRGEG
jgi:hypothetical protein